MIHLLALLKLTHYVLLVKLSTYKLLKCMNKKKKLLLCLDHEYEIVNYHYFCILVCVYLKPITCKLGISQ